MSTIQLSECVETLESGSRPRGGIKEGQDGIPSLGAEHLTNSGGFDFKKLKRIPTDYYNSLKRGRIAEGDILVVKDGATTGKVSFVTADFPFEEAAINEHIFRLVIDQRKANPKFVFRYLQSPQGQMEIMRDFRGATVGGIGRTFLEKVSLPEFSLPEQARIAAILDKAESVSFKKKVQIELIDELLKSEFVERFGTPFNNVKNLPLSPIKDFGRVVTGNTPPRKNLENYGDEIEWIKSDNINTPSHFLTESEERLSKVGKEIGRIAPSGSTLVTCIAGSPKVIGNAALADREVAFNQQINAVIPSNETHPYFLYCQFLVCKNLIQASSTNSMKGMVSKGKFQEIKFLKPDSAEQFGFGEFATGLFALSHHLQAVGSQGDRLFGSLRQSAFRGEL